MNNEKVKPRINYSEFPGIYYYFCGSCGNGIDKEDQTCPYCKKEIDWKDASQG